MDYKWLAAEFKAVNEHIDKVMERHVEKSLAHNPVKFWGLIAAVVGAISTAVGLIFKFLP